MHLSLLMEIGQPSRRLLHEFAGLGNRQRAETFDQPLGVHPIEPLHGQEEKPFVGGLPGIKSPHQMGMIEPADRFHLPLESRHALGRLKAIGREQLDRRRPIEPGVKGSVDRSHAPLADPLQQAIGTDELVVRKARQRVGQLKFFVLACKIQRGSDRPRLVHGRKIDWIGKPVFGGLGSARDPQARDERIGQPLHGERRLLAHRAGLQMHFQLLGPGFVQSPQQVGEDLPAIWTRGSMHR